MITHRLAATKTGASAHAGPVGCTALKSQPTMLISGLRGDCLVIALGITVQRPDGYLLSGPQ